MFRQKCPKPFPRSAGCGNRTYPARLARCRAALTGPPCPFARVRPSLGRTPAGCLCSLRCSARATGRKNSQLPGWFSPPPLDAGEHWSEQAKPKGAARTAAPSPAGQDAPWVKLRSERSAQRSPLRAGIGGRPFFSSLFFGRAKKRDPSYGGGTPVSKSGGRNGFRQDAVFFRRRADGATTV